MLLLLELVVYMGMVGELGLFLLLIIGLGLCFVVVGFSVVNVMVVLSLEEIVLVVLMGY